MDNVNLRTKISNMNVEYKRIYQGEYVVRKGFDIHLPTVNSLMVKYPTLCEVDIRFK